MKKIIAFCLILGLLSIGCANGIICTNKAKIENILQAIVSDAQAIVTMLSTQVPIPPEVLVIIAAAQQAQAVAQAALDKACPTLADVQAAQTAINATMIKAKATGVKMTVKK